MKYRARCNKRACQARRNLTKHVFEFVHPPKCHIAGCTGLMYIDKYRQRKGPKDHPPVCKCDGYMYPHRQNSKDCYNYEDHIIDRSLRDLPKNSPLRQPEPEGWDPFAFMQETCNAESVEE